MKENITVLCNCRFPSTAAHSVYLARFCESLAVAGALVCLVVPKRFKEVAEDYRTYYGLKKVFPVTKIWSFDFLIFGRLLGRSAFILQYLHFYLCVFARFLFGSRKKIIYTMDTLGCLLVYLGYRVVFESHVGIGAHRKRFLSFLKKVSGVVVTNTMIKEDFVRAGFDVQKILVAPNGVDLSLFSGPESKQQLRQKLHLPVEKTIIAYVGKFKTMGMQKGVLELVSVFAVLAAKGDNTHLLIVGLESSEVTELASLLTEKGVLPDRYTLRGHVSHTEVAQCMKASDILVMNYPNTPYYARSMSPMKMFEYMASGNPIVTSDLPSVRDVLSDSSALFVVPDDEKSLQAGIEKLMAGTDLGRGLAHAAFEKVSDLTWEKRALRIITFISSETKTL